MIFLIVVITCPDRGDHVSSILTGVVCRQLGFDSGYAICCSSYGFHIKQAGDSNVQCDGTEASLLDCPSSITSDGTCDYASVVCVYESTPTNGKRITVKIKLVMFSHSLWGWEREEGVLLHFVYHSLLAHMHVT